MTERLSAFDNDPTEAEQLQLLDAKIAASWGTSVGQQGYGGPHLVAGILYESLYDPAILQHTLPADVRPATRATLEAPLPGAPQAFDGSAPDRSAFVKDVAETMMYGVDIEPVLFPHAREQLELLHDLRIRVLFFGLRVTSVTSRQNWRVLA